MHTTYDSTTLLDVLDEQTFYPCPEDDDFRDRAEEAYNRMLMDGGDL